MKKQDEKSEADIVGNTAGFAGYDEFLRDLKARIQMAQVRAALAVNRELILLYWEIGSDISRRMREHG